MLVDVLAWQCATSPLQTSRLCMRTFWLRALGKRHLGWARTGLGQQWHQSWLVDSELIEVDSSDEEAPQDTFAEFFSPPRVAPWVWQLGGAGDVCVGMIARGGP